MVRVVSRVWDGHVLENDVICSNNVVCLVTDLLSVPLHPTRAPVLQPRLALWEEAKTISIRPAAVSSFVIVSTYGVPSGSARLAWISPATRSSAP